MILSAHSQPSRYASLHPLFTRAFNYIRNTDLLALTPGVHDIIDKQLFVIVEETNGRTRAEAKLECHRKYIDIQLVLAGIDEMGWKPLSDCHQPIADYSSERDIQFFDDVPDSWIAVPAGAFCIFFPEDAHAPLVGGSRIRKLIFKIAVE
jgi:YhcH/YjgK/YiaL family protein